jgi:hypothetical protein
MKPLFSTIFIVCFSHALFAQMHSFGPDGLTGLTKEQKEKLTKEQIIVGFSDDKKEGDKTGLIEAIVIFNNTLETTWTLLSKTEDQSLYLNECKEIKVISKSVNKAVEVHTAGNWLITLVYGIIEYYDPATHSLHWTLDPSHPNNGIDATTGYWQLYAYGKNQTLARYGNIVSLKNVPEFIQDMFKKNGVKVAMESVKKYIDSGGTYRK